MAADSIDKQAHAPARQTADGKAQRRHRNFKTPVFVQTGRIDRERVVTGTRAAAEVLLRSWPEQDCPKRLSAMEACLRVIDGSKPPSHARRAFVAAARKAGILLES